MIRKITSAEITEKQRESEHFVFLEVGSLEEYERVHIARALQVPLQHIADWARSYLPDRGAEIIVYGRGRQDPDALAAAQELERLGYENLFLYEGGKGEWVALGLPIESAHWPPGQIRRDLQKKASA